jgi:hypothetical protein
VSAAEPQVKADLVSELVHSVVLDVVRMRTLGVAWTDLRLAIKDLALHTMFECIEYEVVASKLVVTVPWLNAYGRYLRVVSNLKLGLHNVFIREYVKNGALPDTDEGLAAKAISDALALMADLFEQTDEVDPAYAMVAIARANLLATAMKGMTKSRLIALDYCRWQVTGEIPPRLQDHPLFR